jgi:hypothetical protein
VHTPMRWPQFENVTLTALLELPVCLAIMGGMIAVGAHSFFRALQHVDVMEAVFLMTGPKYAMMEYRAVRGVWPASNEEAAYDPRLAKGGRLSSVVIQYALMHPKKMAPTRCSVSA